MEFEAPPVDLGIMGTNATGLSDSALRIQGLEPYTIPDMIFSLRSFFYMWTPSEMMFKSLDEVPNLFIRLIRYLPLFILVECVCLMLRGKDLPRWNHSLMSVCTGTMVFLPGTIIGNIEFTWFSMLYDRYRIVDLPWNSSVAWIACFFAAELGGYAWHRAAHEVNIMWAFHSVHHTSDEPNIMAAFRLPTFNRQVAILFYLPMAFIFHPAMFYTHYQLSYVSQAWVHTNIFEEWSENFGRIFITPRLHRIHHARNRYCIDKNYGGVLSIWDQIFGTYAPYRKDVPLSYGLVSTLQSFDPLAVQFKHFKSMFARASTYDNCKDKLYTFIMGPGWEPGKPRLGNYKEIPKVYDDKPYDKISPTWCYVYLTWTLFLNIVSFNSMGHITQMLGTGAGVLLILYIFWSIANCGYFLEHKPWVPLSEVLRCASYFLMEPVLLPALSTTPLLLACLRYTSILSLLLWSFKLNMFGIKEAEKID